MNKTTTVLKGIKVNKSMKILKLKGKTVIYVRVMNHFRGQKQVKVGQEH